MARNIVQEKRLAEAKRKAEAKEVPAEAIEEVSPEAPKEKTVYITTEQVTLNNLNVIMAQLDVLYTKMIEGFKQVGVVFEDPKEKAKEE